MSEKPAKIICERYVAFLDIIGFESLIESRPLEEIIAKIGNVLSLLPVVSTLGHIKVAGSQYSPDEKFRAVHLCSFSDSFVIATKDVSRDSLNSVITASFLLARGLFTGGLPVRGAIAKGEAAVIEGTDHIVGKAVVDAIKLERQQAWFGVMLSTDVEADACEEGSLDPSVQPLVVAYPIPLKGSRLGVAGRAINWRLNIHAENGIECLLPNSRPGNDEDKLKVENTLKFLEFLRATDRRNLDLCASSAFPHLHPVVMSKEPIADATGQTIRLIHGDRY